MNKLNDYNHKLPDIAELKRLYFDRKLSSIEIAKIYNVTCGAVLIKFKRYGVSIRSLSESQDLISNHITLIKEHDDFINGLLLGDGCIVMTRNKKSCWYGHSDKNKEYLEWLGKSFNNLGIKCSKITPHTNNTWSIKTLSYREFIKYRIDWYPDGRKKIPDIELTPITLFNWYLGDGNYDKDNKSPKVVICSEFDQAGKNVMSDKLNTIGINNSVYKNCIYIKAKYRDYFFKYITDHNWGIPSSYKYKF